MQGQRPSNEYFVVHSKPESLRSASKRLGNLGQIERIADLDALVLRSNASGQDGRGTWKEIASRLGESESAAPVYVDSDGNPSYPTGDIAVRFSRHLDDLQLQDFASRHHLRLTARNEFIPEQAAFAPVDLHNSYLPEILEDVNAADVVDAAWPKTISRYRRGRL